MLDKNYGLILDSPRAKDWWFGGLTGVDSEPLNPTGQWDDFLPAYEPQIVNGWETLSCVTFSALNCLETLLYAKYGKARNFSDRYTAVMSGTTNRGNTFWNVAESIRNDGLVDESVYGTGDVSSFADYHKPISNNIIHIADDIYNEFDLKYEFVWDTADKLVEALQHGPVQIGAYAYGTLKNGIHQRSENQTNHAMMLYGYDYGNYFKVYDHYNRLYKKLAWDTKFGGALKYNINEKNMPTVTLPNDCFVFMAESPGAFGLHIEGKMYVDDLAKLQAQWILRNEEEGEFVSGPVKTLSKADWNTFPRFNLKNEKL